MTTSSSTIQSNLDTLPPNPIGVEVNSPVEPGEVAELLQIFGSVTERLQSTQTILQAEVRRLKIELRETNEQLRRSRELAALGQMAAGIAHEIRNPLGSIRLYASMLVEDLVALPESQQIATRIEQAVRDLDSVVGDVLLFSREIRASLVPCSPYGLIDQAVASCHALFHNTQIEVHTPTRTHDCSCTPWPDSPLVFADASLINLALCNIIRNAIEAMGDSGILTIHVIDGGQKLSRTDPYDPDDEDNCGRLAFILTDTGPGLDSATIAKVFTPFFTTKNTGTGLGLAIAHRIVDAHGGMMHIWSDDACGLNVCIRLKFPASFESSSSLHADQRFAKIMTNDFGSDSSSHM